MFVPVVLGTKAEEAIMILEERKEKFAKLFLKILNSAIDHVKAKDGDLESLIIRNIRIDNGPALKRRHIKARGRADLIKKRTSHILLTLEDKIKSKTGSKKKAREKI